MKNEVRFTNLQSTDGSALETQIGLEVLGDLTNEALERELADEQLGGLLVATNLAEGDGTGAVAMGLLHAAGGRGRLAGSLGGELLARSLSSGGLASGLLGTRHFSRDFFSVFDFFSRGRTVD